MQRLSKTLHRDHAKIPCMSACLLGVIPSRHQEDVGAGAPRTDHLLLDAADRSDRPVELDLARRSDLEAAVDVAAELLRDVEREREPGRWAADTAEIDVDVERAVMSRRLLDLDPTIGRPFSTGLSIVPTSTSRGRPAARDARASPSRRARASRSAGADRRVSHGLPSTPTITSVGSILPSAGESGATATTARPPASP
jgi:hypothetical protein